jgi:hypothetical protein
MPWGDLCDVSGTNLHYALADILEPALGSVNPETDFRLYRVAGFLSPVQPPWVGEVSESNSRASYVANAWLFPGGGVRLWASCTDGLSNTVAFTEHYHGCRFDEAGKYLNIYYSTGVHDGGNLHRPTFADGGPVMGGRNEGDVYPVVEGGVARASVPGMTFQAAPGRDVLCGPWVPQSHFPTGLLVLLGDGGVRTVRPGVAEGVFWAAVTPAGGEVAGDL